MYERESLGTRKLLNHKKDVWFSSADINYLCNTSGKDKEYPVKIKRHVTSKVNISSPWMTMHTCINRIQITTAYQNHLGIRLACVLSMQCSHICIHRHWNSNFRKFFKEEIIQFGILIFTFARIHLILEHLMQNEQLSENIKRHSFTKVGTCTRATLSMYSVFRPWCWR